jgi:glycosyltransferase involved in cell wall biosynthesis
MEIAFIGARGIPASYGGFDTLVEELATGLASSHHCIVYCRSGHYCDKPSQYRGVHLKYLPALKLKVFESLFHTFLCSLHLIFNRPDVVYIVDNGNAPIAGFLRLFGLKVIIHTDGLGWKRKKWGPVAQRLYRLTESLSTLFANAIVTDNPIMTQYYKDNYGADGYEIIYGAKNSFGVDDIALEQHQLLSKSYILIVARIEPDNNVDLLIEGYVKSKCKKPLVVVGDTPYSHAYSNLLRSIADDRVLFLGRIDDQRKLNSLYAGAYVYLHGHEVGGTNPSLLRAMDAGTAPAVIDVPFNRTVIDDGGLWFGRDSQELANLINHWDQSPELIEKISKRAKAIADERYLWSDVVNKHEVLFQEITQSP